MKYSIENQLVQNQQMILSPKMIEELRILQMSTLELNQYLDEIIEENPFIEVEYSEDSIDKSAAKSQQVDFTAYTSQPISLKEYLKDQVRELKIDKLNKIIVNYIIENIDDDGYLCNSINEMADELHICKERVSTALRIVQDMEPEGIGARNLKECLLIQLKRKDLLDEITKRVVMHYLEWIGKRKYTEIAKELNVSKQKVLVIHEILKTLQPRPGQAYTSEVTIGYVIPEIIVREINNEFLVMFADEKIPLLTMNQCYREIIKQNDTHSDEYKFIKEKIKKADEIIRAVEQRKSTILKITTFIVQYQQEFFRKGYTFLKPLTLKEVAYEVGVHESTVSRTVNNKYIETPRGIFELKFFFSSNIQKNCEETISSNGVKDMIKKIISEEDKTHPLSDEKIRKILEQEGIGIARRTVAKYREELGILPTIKRR